MRLVVRSAAVAVLWCVAQGIAQEARVIRAGSYVAPDGTLQSPALLVIRDGRISAVGGESPAGLPVDDFGDAVISPGLIDAYAALTAAGQTFEFGDVLSSEVNTRDAFDRYSDQLEAALAAGVTTFALFPDERSLIGGQVALCQTYGGSGTAGVLPVEFPALAVSLSEAVYQPTREPTSRSGALSMLRRALSRGSNESDPALAQALAGKRPLAVLAPRDEDVRSALALADEFKLRLLILHTRDARGIASTLAARKQGVVVGPLSLTSDTRAASAAAVFEKAGVPVAIAGGLPRQNADSLRIGAAVAARHGFSSAAARRSITVTAAELLEVADHVGALRPGLRADLVIFSGDPLDLRSRRVATYVGGRPIPRLHSEVQP